MKFLILVAGAAAAIVAGLLGIINLYDAITQERDKPKQKGVLLFCIVLVIILVAAYWYVTYTEGQEDTPDETVAVTTAVTTTAASAPPAWDYGIGDTVSFGTWEQDGNTGNGFESIYWQIYDEKDGQYLLVSQYALDSQQYALDFEETTWDTSYARSWLNDHFYEEAFSDSEKARIADTLLQGEYGPDTQDKVFLLSIDEVMTYMPREGMRLCSPTTYAYDENRRTFRASNGYCWWILRSPGENLKYVISINPDGSVDRTNGEVDARKGGIRPAIWVNPQ